MDKNTATEMLLRMNPLLAIVNYASVIIVLYVLASSYKNGSLHDAILGCLWVIAVRYGVVSVLRWRALRKFESLADRENETEEKTVERIHAQTVALFSDLKIVQQLADLHRLAIQEHASKDERNDLVMGAARTLYFAAAVAQYKTLLETQDSVLADKVANSIINDSAISNIFTMIRQTVPSMVKEPAKEAYKEIDILSKAATMFDRLLRKGDHSKAVAVWSACAKGSYTELPMIYAG